MNWKNYSRTSLKSNDTQYNRNKTIKLNLVMSYLYKKKHKYARKFTTGINTNKTQAIKMSRSPKKDHQIDKLTGRETKKKPSRDPPPG